MQTSYKLLFITNNEAFLEQLSVRLDYIYRVIPGGSNSLLKFSAQEVAVDLVIWDQTTNSFSNTESCDKVRDTANGAPILIMAGEKEVVKPDCKNVVKSTSLNTEGELDLERLEIEINRLLVLGGLSRVSSGSINELKEIIRELNFLQEIGRKISETKPFPQLMQEIMESSKIVMRAEAGSILLKDEESKMLHFHTVSEGNTGELIKQYSVEIGTGVAGWVARNKLPVMLNDCYADPRFNPEYDQKTNFTTRNMMCVPLLRKDQVLGVMQVINKLNGDQFSQHEFEIFEMLAAQCAVAIENAQLIEQHIETETIRNELQTARKIQQNLLPTELPVIEKLQVAAKLVPAKEVGGDYYNVIPINETQTLFCIADVSGKSISAALFVSTLASSITTYLSLNRDAFNLLEMIENLNRVMIQSTTPEKFATAWFGLYDHSSSELTSVNAGHNNPFLLHAGSKEPVELKAGGLVLGFFEKPYQSETVLLGEGDTVIIYTDGISEAMNGQEEEYSEERLVEVIGENLSREPASLVDSIFESVRTHAGGTPQSDDMACVVIRH